MKSSLRSLVQMKSNEAYKIITYDLLFRHGWGFYYDLMLNVIQRSENNGNNWKNRDKGSILRLLKARMRNRFPPKTKIQNVHLTWQRIILKRRLSYLLGLHYLIGYFWSYFQIMFINSKPSSNMNWEQSSL